MNFLTNLDPTWIILNQITQVSVQEPLGELNSNILVNVYPEWYKQITVAWEIPSSWGACTFNVYYDESVTTSIRRLTSHSISTPYYKDVGNQEYSKFKKGFYTIEVIFPNGKRVKSYPTSWEPKRRDRLEKLANEIQRREYMLLSKFAGVKSFFFKRKTYGPRCPRCWNATQERVMDDHCPVCYGTSFEGGYHDPVPIFVQYEQTSKNKVKDYLGVFEPNSISGWTISIPEMSPRDIIMRGGDYNVYKVVGIQNTEIQTKQVRQILSLTQFSKTDVENLLGDRVLTDNVEYLQDGLESQFTKNRFNTRDLDIDLRNDHDWTNQQSTHLLPKYQIPELPVQNLFSRGSFVVMTDDGTSDLVGQVEAELVIDANTGNAISSMSAESLLISEGFFETTTEDGASSFLAETSAPTIAEAQFAITTQSPQISVIASGFYDPELFFDMNPDATGSVTGTPVALRSAYLTEIFQDSFLDFESTTHMNTGTAGPLVNTFSGPKSDVTVTFTSTETGLRYVDEAILPVNSGRFNTTSGGSKYLEAYDNVTGTFSGGPVTAFGFYGTDWGDFGGSMNIRIKFTNGTEFSYYPVIFSSAEGNLMFFGIKAEIPIESFTLMCVPDPFLPGFDYFAIDDIVIGNIISV